MTAKSKFRFIRHKNKAGFISYFDIKEQKPANRKDFFKQFRNLTSYPFKVEELTKEEKLSLRYFQRVTINNKFIPKEKESKVKFEASSKGIDLKGKAENLGIEPLKEVLAKTRQTWLNTDQTIKKMIQRHKAGKKVSVKYKGKVYEGLEAIEILEKYVAFLMDKAEKENRRVAFILMKNTQK